jgi:tRNA (guanine-N(7)-)-methyltransferase
LEPVETSEIEKALRFVSAWEHCEIEVGSGNGHFLVAYGERNRNIGLLGIELKKKRCGKIEKKIDGKRLLNILVVQGRAESLLEKILLSSVDAFHFYFPDPWPKTKQRKRRLLKMPIIETLHLALKKNGLFFFASDVFDYYIQVKLLGILHGGFIVRGNEIPAEAVLSMYSTKTEIAGKSLHGLVLQKKDNLEAQEGVEKPLFFQQPARTLFSTQSREEER